MESSKITIEYAWDEVCQKIYDGICPSEIHIIAETIRNLECIEKFMETMDEESDKIDSSSSLIKNIKDEIIDAEKYLDKFKETQNQQFKIIAKQEWDHAGLLVKMIDNTQITNDERIKLRELVNKHNALSSKLV